MKRFNVTGLCIPEEDYMADISGKIEQITKLIDDRCYFVINRARQYGKTTMLFALERALKDRYTIISISFEGLGAESFASTESFCRDFLTLVSESLCGSNNNHSSDHYINSDIDYARKWADGDVTTFKALGDHISRMCTGKEIVLMIDEVDKTTNNAVFLQFLSMLRDKFLARKRRKSFTFHSVILTGVYDIKNIKFKMIREGLYEPSVAEEHLNNSPWNIAADFNIDMSLNPVEIAGMLTDYDSDHHTGMDLMAVSETIHSYTSGYPFLVSRICQYIDAKNDSEWTTNSVRSAAHAIVNEKNTLFDDIIMNLENNVELSSAIYDLLILGEAKPYVAYDKIASLGVLYGFFRKSESGEKLEIANRMFELLMTNYLISNSMQKNKKITGVLQHDLVMNGIYNRETNF